MLCAVLRVLSLCCAVCCAACCAVCCAVCALSVGCCVLGGRKGCTVPYCVLCYMLCCATCCAVWCTVRSTVLCDVMRCVCYTMPQEALSSRKHLDNPKHI